MFSLSRFESLPGPMLVSLVNTQLRDHFASLQELALYHDIAADALSRHLERAGFIYVEAQNQFKAQ